MVLRRFASERSVSTEKRKRRRMASAGRTSGGPALEQEVKGVSVKKTLACFFANNSLFFSQVCDNLRSLVFVLCSHITTTLRAKVFFRIPSRTLSSFVLVHVCAWTVDRTSIALLVIRRPHTSFFSCLLRAETPVGGSKHSDALDASNALSCAS